MKNKFRHAMLVVAISTTAVAAEYKMTTPIAPGVATPDTLETSIGTLHLSDGFPNPDTVEKIYDNLDRSRALQAYLLAIPIVNQAGMRDSLRQVRAGQPDGRHLGNPGRREDRGTDGERQHDLQLHLDRYAQGTGGAGGSADVLGCHRRLLVSLGRRHRHHRRRQGQGRQVPDPSSRLRRGSSGRLFRRTPEHLRQLGTLPNLSRGWIAQARGRVGQEAPEDLPACGCSQSVSDEVRQRLGRPGELRGAG